MGSSCGPSKTLEQCAQSGNFLASILNAYINRPLPRVVGLNGAYATITQGPKFLMQNGASWLMSSFPGLAKNRFGRSPQTADFILPVGAPIDLNNVAENTLQGAPVLGQGATLIGKVYDIDVPENVSSQAVTVAESIETDDSTQANPQADVVNVQVKSRCSSNSRIQSSFFLFEAVDAGGSCNAYATAKDYGMTFQTENAYTPNGNNRVRTSTVNGPAGTGVSITPISTVSDLVYEIACGYSEIIGEILYGSVKGQLAEDMERYKEEVRNAVIEEQKIRAQQIPQQTVVPPQRRIQPVQRVRQPQNGGQVVKNGRAGQNGQVVQNAFAPLLPTPYSFFDAGGKMTHSYPTQMALQTGGSSGGRLISGRW